MYTFETRVRFSDVTQEGCMDNAAVINAFQDCSTFQSEDLGLGDAYMRGQGLSWMVVYWNLHVYRHPSLGEPVRVGTSPYAMNGFLGYRNFMLETLDGERLAEADSVWVLIDRRRQVPVRVLPVMKERYTLCERFPMEETQRKIKFGKKVGAGGAKTAGSGAAETAAGGASATSVGAAESAVGGATPDPSIKRFPPILVDAYRIDTNGHMNNAQYLRIAETISPAVRQTRHLRIEYRKQAYEGDTIVPELHGDSLVLLCDSAGEPYALLSAEGEEGKTT